jgi:hypothetical protein
MTLAKLGHESISQQHAEVTPHNSKRYYFASADGKFEGTWSKLTNSIEEKI